MRRLAWLRRALIVLPLVAVLGLMLATVASAAEGGGSGLSPIVPKGESPNGRHIYDLYLGISIPAILIFLLVEGLLLTVIIRFRRSRQPKDYQPPQWHGHRLLEISWTAVPLLIVFFIGLYSFIILQRDYTAAASDNPDVDIHVVGHQYGWDYTYPEGFTVSSEGLQPTPLVIPTGKLVRLRLDAKDVIHGFWVPALAGKADLVPGYQNLMWVKVDRPGEWRGECTELCGQGHYTMQIRVKAVSEADYQAFKRTSLAAKAKAGAPSPSSSPSAAPSGSPAASPAAGASPSARPTGSAYFPTGQGASSS
ncbi:MAG: cytochrome c oxidase subunit II [Candidatus Dormibacteraeota bacterium]|nr:cytochrome c oxidase subunit II [Candidatus Dormibacteraeota bacterium]